MISDKLRKCRSAQRGSSELIGQQSSIRPTNQGLLSRLPEHLSRSLFSRAATVRLKPDEVLFLAGDPGDGCYRVIDGLLKVVMMSRGNERILAFLGLGAIVGGWQATMLGCVHSRKLSAVIVAAGDPVLSLSRYCHPAFP